MKFLRRLDLSTIASFADKGAAALFVAALLVLSAGLIWTTTTGHLRYGDYFVTAAIVLLLGGSLLFGLGWLLSTLKTPRLNR